MVLAESGINPNTKVRRISRRSLAIGVIVLLIVGIVIPPLGVILIPSAIILGAASFFASKTMKQKIALDRSLSQWAQQRGWKFSMNQTLGRLEGRIFLQQPVVLQDLVAGTIQNLGFMLFNNNFTVTYQNSQLDYGFTVAKVDFSDTKPRFVCQSKQALSDMSTVRLGSE